MKTYQMFSGFSKKLLEDDPIIEAKNSADACRKLLRKLNIPFTKIERSAEGVIVKAQPFYEKDGIKYRNGNAVWYKVWKDNDTYYF